MRIIQPKHTLNTVSHPYICSGTQNSRKSSSHRSMPTRAQTALPCLNTHVSTGPSTSRACGCILRRAPQTAVRCGKSWHRLGVDCDMDDEQCEKRHCTMGINSSITLQVPSYPMRIFSNNMRRSTARAHHARMPSKTDILLPQG